MRDVVWLPLEGLLVHVIADSNCALEDEVHLQNLLFFVVNHTLVLFVAEVARLQTEGHVVEELAVLVLGWVEEEAEVVKDVVEQVVHNDAALYLPWQRTDELVVFLDLTEPIVGPEVLEVLIDLAVERVGEWLVTEASQECHPVVQIKCLLLISQVLVKSRDDLNEGAHDEREEGDAEEHDKNSKDHFVLRLGGKVTIANR